MREVLRSKSSIRWSIVDTPVEVPGVSWCRMFGEFHARIRFRLRIEARWQARVSTIIYTVIPIAVVRYYDGIQHETLKESRITTATKWLSSHSNTKPGILSPFAGHLVTVIPRANTLKHQRDNPTETIADNSSARENWPVVRRRCSRRCGAA